MKVRELLQTEIWSKETSRKILEPMRKILFWILPSRKNLIRIGIVLGVLVVVLGSTLAVESLWMTSGERKVAREALAEIDAMQNLVSADSDEFTTRDKQAKEKVAVAERAVWTLRDSAFGNLLSEYLYLTEQDRREMVIVKEAMREFPVTQNSHSHSWDKSDLAGTELRNFFRAALHKELDKR